MRPAVRRTARPRSSFSAPPLTSAGCFIHFGAVHGVATTSRSGCSFDASATIDVASWAWGLGDAVCRPIPRSRARETCRSRSAGAGPSSTEHHPWPWGRRAGEQHPAHRTAAGPKRRSSRHRCLATADGDHRGRPARVLSRIHGTDRHRAGAGAGRGPWARTPMRRSGRPVLRCPSRVTKAATPARRMQRAPRTSSPREW